MLYKLGRTHDEFDSITPQPYTGLPLDKKLEDLLAENLWDVLWDGKEWMPISQERAWKSESDVYALNKQGDLAIFELIGGTRPTFDYFLFHCQKAARMDFGRLQDMFQQYHESQPVDLQEAHRSAFGLEHPLDRSVFNQRQHLVVAGSATDEDLIRSADYWQSQGLLMNFIPYRLYRISGDFYFEFSSLPPTYHDLRQSRL